MVDAKLTHEEQMMARAINNATKARPRCMPNPWVGAVLVSSDGQVFDGFTQEFGGEHAETVCLNEAGEKAQGAFAVHLSLLRLRPGCHQRIFGVVTTKQHARHPQL